MSYAIPVHVALVDDTDDMDPDLLLTLAGALNEQVIADFAPHWHVRATVGAYRQIPAHTWAIRVREDLDEPGALGYHTDELNVPVSYVMLTDDAAKTISHELLEMLADPWGNRMHGARLPEGLEESYEGFGLPSEIHHVHYLLEVCDPCEATGYEVGGVELSDFVLPAWYRTFPRVQMAYSHAGGCVSPREVAPGGYVSFCNDDGEWYQVFTDDMGQFDVSDLGHFDAATASKSVREWVDQQAREHRS